MYNVVDGRAPSRIMELHDVVDVLYRLGGKATPPNTYDSLPLHLGSVFCLNLVFHQKACLVYCTFESRLMLLFYTLVSISLLVFKT